MIQAAKIIATGLAATGLAGATLGLLTGLISASLSTIFVVFTLLGLTIAYLNAEYLQFLSYRVFLSLEWLLNTPPKPHAFSGLSIQSVTWLNFVFNNLIVVTCIERVIGGVTYYFYFTAEGALVFITNFPYNPFG